jgi:hypothetical protein
MRTRRALAAACVLLAVAAPAHAQPQRGVVWRMVELLKGQLTFAVEEPAPPPARAGGLRPCGALWDQKIREVAEGREMAWTYGAWLDRGYDVIRQHGGLPLPLCFDAHYDTLTTRQGHALLTLNNEFIAARERAARGRRERYRLTGYPDPAEHDPALALRRAEWIQAQTILPPCRLIPAAELRPQTEVFHRKVFYTLVPTTRPCPPQP